MSETTITPEPETPEVPAKPKFYTRRWVQDHRRCRAGVRHRLRRWR